MTVLVGWCCDSVAGIRSSHSIVEDHRLLAERLMLESAELEQKRKDRLYLIKELVYNHISGVKDVRKVTNTEECRSKSERVALGGDPQDHGTLTRIPGH